MFIPLNNGNVGYLIFFQNICIKSPWYLHYTTMFFGEVTFLMAKYSTLFNRIQPPSPTIHLPFTNRVQTRGFTSPRSAQHRDPRAGTKWPQILGWHKASFVFAVLPFFGSMSNPKPRISICSSYSCSAFPKDIKFPLSHGSGCYKYQKNTKSNLLIIQHGCRW